MAEEAAIHSTETETYKDLLDRQRLITSIMAKAAWYAVTGFTDGWATPFDAVSRLISYTNELKERVTKLTAQVCELRSLLR